MRPSRLQLLGRLMDRVIWFLGAATATLGGVLLLGLAAWALMEFWWRLSRTAGLLGDLMAWKRAKKAGTWPPPEATERSPQTAK